jgi:hypothetical protein
MDWQLSTLGPPNGVLVRALLRKEAQEWRACRAKYIAPRDSGAAAGSGDEEDEELVAKYGAHAALGGVLTGRLNSVFTTVCGGSPQRRAAAVRRRHALPLRLPPQVDAVAQSLNVAGAVIDAAPAAIAAASRALHAEGFCLEPFQRVPTMAASVAQQPTAHGGGRAHCGHRALSQHRAPPGRDLARFDRLAGG